MASIVGSILTTQVDAAGASFPTTAQSVASGLTVAYFLKWEDASTAATISGNPTDNAGNVYTVTALQAATAGTAPGGAWVWCTNVVGNAALSTTITFSSATTTFKRAVAYVISDLALVPLDGTPTTNSGTGTSYTVGAISVGRPGIVLAGVAGFTALTGQTAAGTPTFTLGGTVSDTFTVHLLNTQARSVSPAASATGSAAWKMAALAFANASLIGLVRAKGPRVSRGRLGERQQVIFRPIPQAFIAASGSATFNDSATDALTATDATTVQASFNSAASDSLTVSDSQTGQSAFSGAVTDALSITDTQDGATALGGASADSLTATDSQTVQAAFNSAATDALNATDAQTAQASLNSAAADSLTLTDAQTGAFAFAGTATDALTISDTQNGATALGGQASDVLTATDAQTVQATFVSAAADSATVADSTAASAVLQAQASDSLTVTDATDATQIAGGTSQAADALTVADSQAVQAVYLASVADALTISDTQDGVNPNVAAPTPAGGWDDDKPRKKKRLLLEIDGKTYNVTEQQLREFERQWAEEAAEKALIEARKATTSVKAIKPVAPRIVGASQSVIDLARHEYRKAYEAAVARAEAEEEDDVAMILMNL